MPINPEFIPNLSHEGCCEYCGEYADSLHEFRWDEPATFDTPPDNGSMIVCQDCFDKFNRKWRSAV